MSISKLNENLNIISSLPDKPTLDASGLKSKFDEGNNIIKDFINSTLIPEVEEGQAELVNNLTDGGTTSALSAEMGKKLNLEKQKVISYGIEVPSLTEGEIFIQIFDEENEE